MRSLRAYLVVVATLLVVLVCTATGLLVWQVVAFSRAEAEAQLLDTARAMSLAIDGRLQSYEAALKALNGSEALKREDWPAFDRQARDVLAGPDAWITVTGRDDGRQRVNTLFPVGQALPAGRANRPWGPLDAGRTQICDLIHGFLNRDILCVAVPVMKDGRTAYSLSAVFKPQILGAVAGLRASGERRFLGVIDRNGVIIWRNGDPPEKYIGRSAAPPMLSAIRSKGEGVREGMSPEGVPTMLGFSRSPLSGWTSVVALPRAEVIAPARNALTYGLLTAAGLMAMGAWIGLAAGRRIGKAVDHLSASARRIRAGEPPAFQPSGLEEIDAVGTMLDQAIADRQASEERSRLLMREVDHRANNLMAVVQGAVNLSRAPDAGELRRIIIGRVDALARAHQLLAASRWTGADLRRLVDEEMLPFNLGDTGRVRIEGQSIALSPAAAQSLAMAVHELATNAAKHGALSSPGGRASIGWRVEGDWLHIRWEEAGGPRVEAPKRKGFGTTVLQRTLEGALEGRTDIQWRPEGLVCDIALPLAEVAARPRAMA